MYERFTDRARKVMQLANEEAQRFRHEYIGTEHLLLALIKEGTGVAATVLKDLDIDLRIVRLEVEKIVQPGPDFVPLGKLPQTPRVKRVVELAIEEARNLTHNYVGTEHLLLGLVRENEGIAAQVLLNLGVRLAEVRDKVLALVSGTLQTTTKPATASVPSPLPPECLHDLPTSIGSAVAALDELVCVLQEMKENAVGRHDFEWAASLRDQEYKLRKMREWLLANKDREPHQPPEQDPA